MGVDSQEAVRQFQSLMREVHGPLENTFQNVHQGYPSETLVRFLKAREWNVHKAHKMLMDSLQWRVDNEIDDILTGTVILICIAKGSSGFFAINRDAYSKVEGDCMLEVQRAIPVLKKSYGDSMRKVLHVGPDSCSVVSKLVKEDEIEAWGVEPYDIEDADANCKGLVRKGFVRVADIKFPLPYQPKSFSLVIVSDALDYLSPKYLNKTLLDLARVSADGLVAFSGLPGRQKAKVAEASKFGRPAKMRSSSWWVKYFMRMSLEGNEAAATKFQQAALKMSYGPSCQVFHLKSYH